jgi:hypothetical protein
MSGALVETALEVIQLVSLAAVANCHLLTVACQWLSVNFVAEAQHQKIGRNQSYPEDFALQPSIAHSHM